MIYAAIIAVCVLVAVIVGAFLKLALMVRDSDERASDYRAADTAGAGTIAILKAEVATHKNVAETERRRADALDDELARVAADGDVAGARERVLARWRRQAGGDPVPTTGDGAGPVPASEGGATAPFNRDALERP